MSAPEPKNINRYLIMYVLGHVVISAILFGLAAIFKQDVLKDVVSFSVVQAIICIMMVSIFKITHNHSSKWDIKN
jgi:uncharacterized MnhB-related membrane protein